MRCDAKVSTTAFCATFACQANEFGASTSVCCVATTPATAKVTGAVELTGPDMTGTTAASKKLQATFEGAFVKSLGLDKDATNKITFAYKRFERRRLGTQAVVTIVTYEILFEADSAEMITAATGKATEALGLLNDALSKKLVKGLMVDDPVNFASAAVIFQKPTIGEITYSEWQSRDLACVLECALDRMCFLFPGNACTTDRLSLHDVAPLGLILELKQYPRQGQRTRRIFPDPPPRPGVFFLLNSLYIPFINLNPTH